MIESSTPMLTGNIHLLLLPVVLGVNAQYITTPILLSVVPLLYQLDPTKQKKITNLHKWFM